MPYFNSADVRRRLKDALRTLEAAQGDPRRASSNSGLIAGIYDSLRELEESIEDRDEHLAFLWENNPLLCWIADTDKNLINVSKSWVELTGTPMEEALGDRWRTFVHPDDADAYIRTALRAAREGGSYDMRFRARTADGTYHWLRTRAVSRLGDDGRPEFVYGYTEDINEQVQAETAVQIAAERARLAGLATNDLIYDLDIPSGQILWNDAIRDYCESKDEASLDWWKDAIHPADRSRVIDSLNAFLASEDADRWQAEYRLRRLDSGFAHVYERGYLVRGEDGSAARMIGAITDLTARIEAEARVKQLQSELIHVSRLSAMGAMAATLAHELNQPLAAANNWIGVARMLVQKTPEIAEAGGHALDEARGSIQRAGEIIRRIRTMLWRGKDNREVHDLRELIDESLRLALLGASTSGIACRLSVESVNVFVDRIQIEQVILNLVRNAIEAMADQPRRELVIVATRREGLAEVQVSDTGPGLDANLASRLFTPFVTNKDHGLGVGLSISRTIIEAHGGQITARTNADGGATFTFTLPQV